MLFGQVISNSIIAKKDHLGKWKKLIYRNCAEFLVVFKACQQELHNLAGRLMRGERPNHTLQPNALVNEAYLRLFNTEDLPATSRVHFVNIAARTMRQILIEHARRRSTAKRGGDWKAITLTGLPDPEFRDPLDLISLHDALESFVELDQRAARIVDLRIFGGLTMEEIAALIGVSRQTIQKDWQFAIRWLRRELSAHDE